MINALMDLLLDRALLRKQSLSLSQLKKKKKNKTKERKRQNNQELWKDFISVYNRNT